jgi:hypothetical protein
MRKIIIKEALSEINLNKFSFDSLNRLAVQNPPNLDLAISNLIASDYDFLNIDLSTARTDQLIASSVIAFYILDASSGATYSIKLFSATKPALDQSVLPKGSGIERLAKANLYLTNTAQSGAYVKILVLKG